MNPAMQQYVTQPPQPQAMPQQPSIAQTLYCPHCSTHMSYPPNTPFIRCPGCQNAIDLSVSMQGTCLSCATLLQYPITHQIIQCPRCMHTMETRYVRAHILPTQQAPPPPPPGQAPQPFSTQPPPMSHPQQQQPQHPQQQPQQFPQQQQQQQFSQQQLQLMSQMGFAPPPGGFPGMMPGMPPSFAPPPPHPQPHMGVDGSVGGMPPTNTTAATAAVPSKAVAANTMPPSSGSGSGSGSGGALTNAAGLSAAAPRITKKRRDPNAPKAVSNAYMIFCKSRRAELKQQFPDLPFGKIGAKLGDIWRQMTPDEKKPFEDRATADRERYRKQMLEYQNGEGGEGGGNFA